MGMSEVPVDPDADQARDWLLEELTKTKYQEQPQQEQGPSWIDDLLDAVTRFLNSLDGQETVPFWVVLLVIVGVAVVVVAFLVFGVPKLRARSSVVDDELFEADDHRDAAAMRRDADNAATRTDLSRHAAHRHDCTRNAASVSRNERGGW